MAASGSKRVEIACWTWRQGKTDRSHSKFVFPDDFDTFHTCTGQMNACVHFFEKIVFPYVDKVREAMKLIMDNFSGQTTDPMLENQEEKGIVLVMVPANMTDQLQPLEHQKFSKAFLIDKFKTWQAEQIEKQLHAGVEGTAVTVNMSMAVMKG